MMQSLEVSSSGSAEMGPIVSVVIPSYNHAQFLREAVVSVLHQSQSGIELIIIDDGSRDDSPLVIEGIIAEYRQADIISICRENRGLCRTLNEGLALAKGKYFAYLGSDDRWYESRLKRQIEVLERSDPDVGACYCDCDIIDSEGKTINRAGAMFKYKGGNIYRDILWGRSMPMSPTGTFRTEIVRNVGGFDESHAIEDKDLWLRISKKYQIAYVDETLGSWRVHGSNTSKNLEGMQNYGMAVVDKALKSDESLRKNSGKLFARIDAIKSAEFYELLEMKSAREFAVLSIRRWPFGLLAWRTYLFSLLGRNLVSRIRSFRRARRTPGRVNGSKL